MPDTKSVDVSWVSSKNQVGDYIVLQKGVVLSMHYRPNQRGGEYALVKWWYGNPTVLQVVESNSVIYRAKP